MLKKKQCFPLLKETKHILRFGRAETGLGDEIHQVSVWVLRGLEMKVDLCEINNLRLFNCDGTNRAGNLHWQLVLHRKHVDHHGLLVKQTGSNTIHLNLI